MLATFDAPTRALRCAFELREAVARMGLQVRAAIHTGEVERRHDDVGGIGVHIAARPSAPLAPIRWWWRRTVRDLATGTDLQFVLSALSVCGASQVNGNSSRRRSPRREPRERSPPSDPP